MQKLQYSEKLVETGKYDFKTSRQEYQWKAHYPMWSFYFGGMKTFCGIKKNTYSLNNRTTGSSVCEICLKRDRLFGWTYNFSLTLNSVRYKISTIYDNFLYRIGL